MTCLCNFLLNDFCVGVVTKNTWATGEVTLWLFSLVFQMIDYYHHHKRLKLIFIVFELFIDYFSMISAGFLCTAAVVVDDVVLGVYELSVVSMFLSFALWKNEIDTGNVRILVVMSDQFRFCLPSLWTQIIPFAIMEWVIYICQMLKW